MYTRIGKAAYKSDLNNTISLCKALGHPEQKIRTIHIAGTNGKGSVSNMLAAVLQASGYNTGLYTSPHLKDFRERIRINGEMISKDYVVDFVKNFMPLFEEIKPSFFEMNVALCFDYFYNRQPDISIIETGLGGRLDSTNVITPIVSCITNIGYDHMDLLGNTLEEIAKEKAGIIKPGIPVIIGEGEKETKQVFEDKALSLGSRLIFANQQFKTNIVSQTPFRLQVDVTKNDGEYLNKLDLDLAGNYQFKNVITTLSIIEELRGLGFQITESNIRFGLSQVKKLTGFSGRWQVLQNDPLVIADTGHNSHGIKQTMLQLEMMKPKQLHIVFGIVKDKDLSKVLEIMPTKAKYYLGTPDMPRALPANNLLMEFTQAGFEATAYSSVLEALHAAKKHAMVEDIIFVGGSTFVVAEVV